MNRIVILGSPGAGKSTLSRTLGAVYNLPVIHLDRLYWQPDWVATPNEQWDQTVEQLTMEEQWIIDGNYSRTIDLRLKRAELVILLDMPLWLCLYRVVKRRIKYHKKTRPDLHEACPEKLDWDFIRWIWNYRSRSRTRTLGKLAQLQDKRVVILKSRKQVNEWATHPPSL